MPPARLAAPHALERDDPPRHQGALAAQDVASPLEPAPPSALPPLPTAPLRAEPPDHRASVVRPDDLLRGRMREEAVIRALSRQGLPDIMAYAFANRGERSSQGRAATQVDLPVGAGRRRGGVIRRRAHPDRNRPTTRSLAESRLARHAQSRDQGTVRRKTGSEGCSEPRMARRASRVSGSSFACSVRPWHASAMRRM